RMEGRLEVSGARLSTLLGLFYPDNDLSSYLGNLSGRVDVTSTFFDPRMTGYLTLRDGFFNEVGSYDSELSFSLENGLFSLKEWQVNKNRALLFNSYGWYNFRTQEVNFELLGQNFDANLFVQTCTGKSDVVQGTASVELRVSDQVKTPKIDGELTIRNGTLFGFKFDDMSLVLGEHTTENLAMRGGDVNSQISAIQISDFSLIRERDFSIRGRGEIPYDSDEEMNIRLEAEGNLLSLLPELDSFFKATRSQGRLELILRGRPDSPRMEQGAYEFSDGYLRLGGVVEEIKNIKGKIRLNSEDGFVAIEQLSGTIRGEEFSITNVKEPVVAGAHQLEPFLLEELGLSLGIGILETSPKGIPVNIPGLMEKGELGWLEAVGKTEGEKFYLAGPWEHPTVRGCLRLRGLDFTFPFLPGSQSSSSTVINVLRSIHWDVRAVPTRDTRYVRNIRQGLDNVYVNLLINDGGEGLDFTGMLDDESFRIEGSLESTRGTVEYLDFNFRVERAGVEFDKTTLRPLIYGRAQTTVVDSTNYPFDVWLTLYTVDDETGEKLERGRWGKKLYFELSTENATLGFTDGQILAGLGYSAKNIREKAPDLIAISAENFFLKPLYRPFERQLERILGLDFVQLSSRFYRNLLEYNGNENGQTNSKLALLRSTRVTLGKYLADRLFFLYTGQVETNRTFQYYPERIGLKHTLGLEYRIKPNLLVEMEWDYDSLHLTDKEDKKIMLRHSFPF
ncbi:MAG: translocation/assembly module TamB, partial [candidate division KSB1 bacterium]|nr:translocation/assembly module TamB [candidate division KSB1 bacterium]